MTTDPSELRRDYDSDALDIAAMDNDPMAQFRLWFEQASDADIYEPNAVNMATVSASGRPSSRIVLMKGIEANGFVIYTNYKSRKGRELEANQFAALTFWWDKLHRQVRIEGTVVEVSAAMSDAYFDSRPLGSRLSAIASEQSEPIKDYAELERKVEALQSKHADSAPKRPSHWGGYLIRPEIIEFWQGRSNRLHDRVVYSRRGTAWDIKRLQP